MRKLLLGILVGFVLGIIGLDVKLILNNIKVKQNISAITENTFNITLGTLCLQLVVKDLESEEDYKNWLLCKQSVKDVVESYNEMNKAKL